MKVINIVGENYGGQWNRTRVACRAIVEKEGRLLLSYETGTDIWQLPGGGMEGEESGEACCVREVLEETGVVVRPLTCFLEIHEFYEDVRWVNRYFVCRAVGCGDMRLTDQEKAVGMEPRWVPVEEIKGIFGRYADYAGTEEERRGMYQREYMALCQWEANG